MKTLNIRVIFKICKLHNKSINAYLENYDNIFLLLFSTLSFFYKPYMKCFYVETKINWLF